MLDKVYELPLSSKALYRRTALQIVGEAGFFCHDRGRRRRGVDYGGREPREGITNPVGLHCATHKGIFLFYPGKYICVNTGVLTGK